MCYMNLFWGFNPWMCSDAVLPMVATVIFIACSVKFRMVEMTLISTSLHWVLKMLHDAAAGQEADMSLDDALWCQPVLWCWMTPAFLRSHVMEVVLDLSVPSWLLWMPISAVVGSVISYLINGLLSLSWCRFILCILAISLSSPWHADRSVTLFLEKSCKRYVSVVAKYIPTLCACYLKKQ